MSDIVKRLDSVNENEAPYANATVRVWCHEAAREIERLRAENNHARGLLWYAWYEFNAISARSGAPLTLDGMATCKDAWWARMRDAFAAAIGSDALKPWPSPEARNALPTEPRP